MTVNRERGKVWREITSLYLNYESLDSVISELQSYRDEYGANTRIEKMGSYGSDEYYYAVMYERDETDDEMAKRIAREEQWEADRIENDRRTFERLKAEFGEG